MITIENLDAERLHQLFLTLRADDRRELELTQPHFDAEQLAHDHMRLCYAGFIACYDHRPVAVLSAVELWPGLAQIGLLASDEWPRVAFAVARIAKRREAQFFMAGFHRLQAIAWSQHHAGQNWLRRMGYHLEARLHKFGKNGDDFMLFAKTAP